MSKAGAVWISVLPDMSKWNATVRAEAAVGLGGAGAKAGEGFVAGLKRTLRGGAPFASVQAQATAAADQAAIAVEKASTKVAAARAKAETAAGRVRVAELKLQEIRGKENASASSIAAAEERLAAAERGAATAAENASVAQAGLVTAQERAATATAAAGTAAATSGSRFRAMGTTVGSSVDRMGSKVGHFAKIAGGMAGLFGAFEVAKFAGESVKAATEFQKSSNVLVTAAGESEKNLGKIRDGMVKISDDTGTSTDQLTEGMYTIEKAGIRGASGLKVLDAAAKGAKEENADLGTVTNAMTSIMNSYGLKANKSVQVMNALKTAAAQSKTSMQNFAGSLSTVLPIAAANKISFADVAGAIGTLTSHGTSAQEATQELAFSIRSLSAPNAVAVKEMGQFGIKSQDVATKLGKRGLQGTVNLLSETVLKKMGPSGKVLLDTFYKSTSAAKSADQMFSKLPPSAKKVAQSLKNGSEGYKDWLKSAKELNPVQYNQVKQWAALQVKSKGFNDAIKQGLPGSQTYSEAMKKMMGGATGLNTALMLTGTSAEATKKRTDAVSKSYKDNAKEVEGWKATQKTAAVAQDRMKNSIKNAGMVMATAFLPTLTKLTNKMADGITSVMAWSQKQNWSWLKPTAKAFGVLLAGILAYKAVTKTIKKVKDAFNGLKTAASGVKTAVKGIGRGIRAGVSGGQRAVTALKSGFETLRLKAMYAQDAMKSGWSKGVTGIKRMGSAVKSGAQGLATIGKNALKAAGRMAKAGAVAAANGVKFVALKVASLAVAAAQKVWAATQWLLNAAMSANPITLIVIGLAALAAAVVVAWKRSKTFRAVVEATWKGIKAAALAVFHWMTGTLWPGIKKVYNSLTSGFRAVGTSISNGWSKIKGYFSSAWSWVSGFFKNHWKTILSILLGPVTAAGYQIYKHWGTIKGYFSGAWNWAKTTFKRSWSGIKGVIMAPVNGVKSLISREIRGWKNLFTDAKNGIGKIWGKVKGLFESPITATIHFLGAHFSKPVNSILNKIGLSKWDLPTFGAATGGIMPGYTPGRDVHHFFSPTGGYLDLSGGEAVMRPEVTQAIGVSGVNALNRAAMHGGAPAVRSQLGLATGGVIPRQSFGIGGVIGGIWGGIKDAGGWLKDLASKGAQWVLKHALKPLLGVFGSSWPAKIAKAAMTKVVDALIGKGKDQDSSGGATGGPAPRNVSGAKRIGKIMAAMMGWTGGNWNALYNLWMGESGWNYRAENPSSGAYGIPQSLPGSKMASAGADWRTNPATQIRWGLDYIKARYGSPSVAYGDWLARSPHWYDQGGVLAQGATLAVNASGKPEAVLTNTQWKVLEKVANSGGAASVSLSDEQFDRLEAAVFAGSAGGRVAQQYELAQAARMYARSRPGGGD